ncbi:hypothetical protein DFJ73DRAFT_805087 [Zopfochytrium polystomum]|nr:hypothetical protein DFJ73DRAFT_805087 [Zopfochytrium polystomum]
MDSTKDIAESNMMVAMGVAMITIVVSYWDVIAKINNPFLFWTMIGAPVGHLVHTFGVAITRRDVTRDYDYEKFFFRACWLAAGQIFCLACIQFHTSYRGMLILFPRSNRNWIVPSIVTAIHVGLQIAGLWYYYANWKLSYFVTTTQEVFTLSVVTAVYVSAVETVFFLISQYKIITTLTELSKVEVSFFHVAKMILRSACYISAVIMLFCTSGQFFYSVSTGVIFIYQAPTLMVLILLSDSVSVRELVAHYSYGSSGKTSKLGAQSSVGSKIGATQSVHGTA